MTTPPPSRLRFALRWAAVHGLLSLGAAALAAALVLGLWYPAPWRQLLGAAGMFGLLLLGLGVCGPLLTLLLASPHKTRRERWLDLSLVALIQLAALGYGLWALHLARPVALVFEVDRLVVVTANEVQTEQMEEAPKALQGLPWSGVRTMSLRQPVNTDEFLQSVEQSIQGVTQPMRPGWWRPFEEARPEIVKRSQPLSVLLDKRPAQREQLLEAAEKTGHAVNDLRFIPLVSSKHTDWVALLSASGDMVGHAPVDGFDD